MNEVPGGRPDIRSESAGGARFFYASRRTETDKAQRGGGLEGTIGTTSGFQAR
jgi:hypothetical protein